MNQIGVQTKNIVEDNAPLDGFKLIRQAGFDCVDFSLDQYLPSKELYKMKKNAFFDQSVSELERFFSTHKVSATETGITISQMHMPYPLFVWKGGDLNEYLKKIVAPKSLAVCAFFKCPYIVVHGFKLMPYLGSDEKEWEHTAHFLNSIAPIAKEMGVTVCLENIYNSKNGRITEGPCSDALRTAERIDRLNDRIGSEVFGFCFDIGHANLLGIDFEAFLCQMGSRVKVLHIHDNDAISDLHQLPFTFTRTRENPSATDWNGFIRGLKKIKFQGALCFETSPVVQAFPKPLWSDALSLIAKIGGYFAKELSNG
ncbi:MAG: sugar phosphate isomerase/epimerase [Clostridiales bacterium]|jgi:sugar phosphate isomerase/epimerase|nr:sugar phosphate isomerase/epimerase [Clostridiales bacterium]